MLIDNNEMTRQPKWAIPAWTVGIAFVIAGPSVAQQYHDAALRFSPELPSGGRSMPPDALAAMNDTVRELHNSKITYTAGFQLTTSPPLEYPYVLIHLQPGRTTGMSLDEIEKELATLAKGWQRGTRRTEGKLSDFATDIEFGDLFIDRVSKRFVYGSKMNVAGIGPVKSYTVGMIGKEGIVLMNCYAREADFANRLPAFISLAESFRFDPGHQFEPGSSAPSERPFSSPGDLNTGLVGAIIGGVIVGGLVYLFRRFFARHVRR